MKLTEPTAGTAEQLAAAKALSTAASGFMLKRKIVGVFIGASLGQQFTTCAMNLAAPETVFVIGPSGDMEVMQKFTRLSEHLRRSGPAGLDESAVEAAADMFARTESTLIAVQQLREQLVANLDAVIDLEHTLKGMVDTLPHAVALSLLGASGGQDE
jgi:flagellar motor component MotA